MLQTSAQRWSRYQKTLVGSRKAPAGLRGTVLPSSIRHVKHLIYRRQHLRLASAHASQLDDYADNVEEPVPRPVEAGILEEGGWQSWLWPGKGRKRKIAALFGTAYLEWWLTGTLFWSPLTYIVVLVLLAPAYEAVRRGQAEAVAKAVAKTKAEMAKQVPVTPYEPAQWMNRFMGEVWTSFIEPMILKAELSPWQEKVACAAPSGWDLELVEMTLGKEAPVMTDFRAFNNPETNELTALECNFVFDSSTMRVVVKGSGPLGSFTAIVSGLTMKGTMRFLPLPNERMMLFAFKDPPEAAVRLTVRGPVIGERDIPQFSFIKQAFLAALEDSLVEPRRTAISLDYEYVVQQAVDTTLNIFVECVTGLSGTTTSVQSERSRQQGPPGSSNLRAAGDGGGRDGVKSSPTEVGPAAHSGSRPGKKEEKSSHKQANISFREGVGPPNAPNVPTGAIPSSFVGSFAARGGGGGGIQFSRGAGGDMAAAAAALALVVPRSGGSKARKVQVRATNTFTQLQRSTLSRPVQGQSVNINQLVKIRLGSKDGIVKLTVRDTTKGGHASAVGVAFINVMAAKDGSTLFWACDAETNPIAHRWRPSNEPWRITLPLEGGPPGSAVSLALSVDPWLYQQALPSSTFRTDGPRTIILQIMEGRDLAAHDWAGTSDPYIKISYDGRSYRTRSVYNTLQPIWASTFAFPENPSLLARRIRLECWDSGISRDELMGTATANIDMAHESTVQDLWLQLSGAESGDVRIRMAVVPGAPDRPAAQNMIALLSSTIDHSSRDTLQVVVLTARNLSSRGALLGQRDAYVNITYAGARQVTPVVKQSQNPTWNFPVLFPLEGEGEDVKGKLTLSVMDLSTVPGDDELGHADLDVAQLLHGPGSTWEQWVQLRKGSGNASGAELLVRITHLAPAKLYLGPTRLPSAPPEPIGPGTGVSGGMVEVVDPLSQQASSVPMPAASGVLGALGPSGPGRPRAGPTPGPVLVDHTDAFKERIASGTTGSTAGITAPTSFMSALADQVLAANDSAQRRNDGFRVKLGQEWVPMLKDIYRNITSKPWGFKRQKKRGSDSEGEEEEGASVPSSSSRPNSGHKDPVNVAEEKRQVQASAVDRPVDAAANAVAAAAAASGGGGAAAALATALAMQGGNNQASDAARRIIRDIGAAAGAARADAADAGVTVSDASASTLQEAISSEGRSASTSAVPVPGMPLSGPPPSTTSFTSAMNPLGNGNAASAQVPPKPLVGSPQREAQYGGAATPAVLGTLPMELEASNRDASDSGSDSGNDGWEPSVGGDGWSGAHASPAVPLDLASPSNGWDSHRVLFQEPEEGDEQVHANLSWDELTSPVYDYSDASGAAVPPPVVQRSPNRVV